MPVQQGFIRDEGAPELGRWSVTMKPEAPGLWRKTALRGDGYTAPESGKGLFFDTLCITPTRLRDPGVTRATILSKSVFSGYVEWAAGGRMIDPWQIGGPSLVAWLGNGDNPSTGPVGFSSAGSVSLATFLASLFTGGTPAGVYVNGLQLYSAATCSTNTITDTASGNETARELIERWTKQTDTPTEWWVRPDGQAHFAALGNSALFTQDPTVMLASGISPGLHGDVFCYSAQSDVRNTIAGFATVVRMDDGVAPATVGITFPSTFGTFDPSMQMGSVGGSFDGTNDGGSMAAYYKSSHPTSGQASALVSYRHKNGDGTGQFEDRRERGFDVDAYCLAQHVKPGDWVYLYDADTYATNPNNEVIAGGRITHPLKARVIRMDWPIRAGMGVYLISNGCGNKLDGAGADQGYDHVTDLSDFVQYETGTTKVQINTEPAYARRAFHTYERFAQSPAWR